jgi:acyl-CoA reductase-like NAD-dependent aldehyde dehydrogenase
VHATEPGATTLTLHAPRGVAALFAPWNVPLGLGLHKVAAAIAAGCSVVLKASEQAPLGIRRAVELLHEAGVPPGVVNLVNGRGGVTGAALADADVDCISFTGGGASGRLVAAAAARRHIPAVLELGGKSAFVVFADADLDRALEGALTATLGNNGQACLAGTRLLLEAPIADDFTARFVDRVRRVRIGDPMDPATEVGPLANAAGVARMAAMTALCAPEEVLTGGEQPSGPGHFVEPVVVRVDNPQHPCAQEEIFGPFATILTFGDENEAWEIANATPFGLAAYLWTRDHARVLRGAAALDAGTVMVNAPFLRERNAPFGGTLASGTGSEGGLWSLRFYTREKAVVMAHDWQPGVRWGTQ